MGDTSRLCFRAGSACPVHMHGLRFVIVLIDAFLGEVLDHWMVHGAYDGGVLETEGIEYTMLVLVNTDGKKENRHSVAWWGMNIHMVSPSASLSMCGL